MQFDCPVKRLLGSVSAPEQAFQSVAAVCYGIICGPPAPTPVHTINIVDGIDVANTDEAYVKSLINGGAYITEVNKGGKEHRLSNWRHRQPIFIQTLHLQQHQSPSV